MTDALQRLAESVVREHVLLCSTPLGLLLEYSQQVMHELAQSAVCNHGFDLE